MNEKAINYTSFTKYEILNSLCYHNMKITNNFIRDFSYKHFG